MPDVEHALSWSAKRTASFGLWILAALLLCYFASGIFSIESNELGVLLRFGRIVDSAIPSGIHYAFPWPIDRIIRVPVRMVKRLSVDDFFESGDIAQAFRNSTGISSSMLTGDNNFMSMNCVLQYTISDPAKYLFSLTDNERTLRSFTCNTLIHSVAGFRIDEILTTGKEELQIHVKQELQRRLDECQSGLAVTFVEIQDVRPPTSVQASFDEVINAKIDKEKTINTALSYRNEEIPKAKGIYHRQTQEGEAYQQRVVASAQGESQRFLDLLAEYQRDPEVTRLRLYKEFQQDTLPLLGRICLVAQKDGDPVARLLMKSSASEAAATPVPTQAPTIQIKPMTAPTE